jgi:hypothetical protein
VSLRILNWEVDFRLIIIYKFFVYYYADFRTPICLMTFVTHDTRDTLRCRVAVLQFQKGASHTQKKILYIYIYIESYFLHLRNLIFNCNTATTATLQHCNVVCFPKTQSCEPSDSGVEEVNNLNTFTSSKKKLNFFEKNS